MYHHPYKCAPKRAFWAKSVSNGFHASELVQFVQPLIQRGERVASAGSCFAANIVPYVERAGFEYVRTESLHPLFAHLPEDNFSYAKFSAAYGNIYTARQLLQLLRRANGDFTPAEDRWITPNAIIDPFRPGLRYRATSNVEFDLLTDQHLQKVKEMFVTADVFVFTLGLTEAWVSAADSAVYPACPGTIGGSFDPARYILKNFTVSEVVEDLNEFIREARGLNPELRIVLTISPVPLVATATAEHVVSASIYSKSVLRAAAGEVVQANHGAFYFPSYEIITGPQAPQSYFEVDRRNPSRKAIDEVMNVFLGACQAGQKPDSAPQVLDDLLSGDAASAQMSKAIAEVECEEAMSAI